MVDAAIEVGCERIDADRNDVRVRTDTLGSDRLT